MYRQPFGYPELKRILVNRIGLPEEAVSDDLATSFESLGLDSLGRVEMLLAVQQDYDLVVSDSDALEFVTMSDAITYVNGRLDEMEEVA